MSRVFMDCIKEIRGGTLPSELGELLQKLVADVRATGKGGKLTLTLDVKPMKKAGDNTLLIEDDIRIAAPLPDKPGTILYANDENVLSRKDPRQPELGGLRDVTRVSPMPQNREAANE